MTSTALAINGVRKAAILVVLLGEEAASKVFKLLPHPDLQRLTEEIAEMGMVPPETAVQVLEEYQRLSLTQEYLTEGGKDYAKRLLVKSFGEDGARSLMEQVSQAQQMSTAKLDSLQKCDPLQLSKFLEKEHPQTIALILAHLDAKQGCALLTRLPEEVRAETVRRLAQMRQFSPDMAQKVSLVLHSRLQNLGEQSRRAYAGLKGVADLLNRLEAVSAKGILESIERQDAKLAISIRNLMFTFEDLLTVPDTGIREILAQIDKKSLALALKQSSPDLKEHMFKSMSSRAVDMLKEDMEVLGAVKAKDVQKAQQDVVAVARRLENEGKLSLSAEGEDEYVL
jgi:flagellar motor switch protein FliG